MELNLSKIVNSSLLPRRETELLMAHLLKKTLEKLLAHPEFLISPAVYKKFQALEKKRLANWPIAYLVGAKEFYGLDFKVSPAVLTPRPETEIMVEDIIETVKNTSLKPLVIDLGTGSGAIIISTAKELKRLAPNAYRRTEFLAVDISGSALKIAKGNTIFHKLTSKINFSKGNLLVPLKLDKRDLSGQELIIAANLPYLTKAQIKEAPSISQEPILALDGGKDGLKYYRELFGQLKKLKFGATTVLCEIDPIQTDMIIALAGKHFPQAKYMIKPDYSGQNRFFVIKL